MYTRRRDNAGSSPDARSEAMMPSTVLQFDPSSLALWFGLPGSQDADTNEIVSRAVNLTLHGRLDDLQDLYRLLIEHPQRQQALETRMLGSVSSIWHECRHFIDLVLTNHGGFRSRRYGTIYANLEYLI